MNTKRLDSSASPSIQVIPATVRSMKSGGQIETAQHLRVAAYCRVSTGDESQQTSYAVQKTFYEELITHKANWELVEIFADEGISGTSTKRRKEFQRMMETALEGKIDYIVTKSISRFARNTVDTLSCIRQLQGLKPPVGIFFEKENIDTLDGKSELFLTLLSGMAQDESRSISDNIKWSIQKKYERGIAHINPTMMLGYKLGEDGQTWEIVEEEAAIVRTIFQSYLAGWSASGIARALNEKGYKTIRGNKWGNSSVLYILKNEKYVGDCEMQKYITESYLTHRCVWNQGQQPRFYVENHHVPIISREMWNAVRRMMALQRGNTKHCAEKARKAPNAHVPLFHNAYCGLCGSKMVRKRRSSYWTGHPNARGEGDKAEKERYNITYMAWQCAHRKPLLFGKMPMPNPHHEDCSSDAVLEFVIEQCFMEMLYRLKRDSEQNGSQSSLDRAFNRVLAKEIAESREYQYTQEKIAALNMELRELREKREEILQKLGQASAAAAQRTEEAWHNTCENRPPELYAGHGEENPARVYSALLTDLEQRLDDRRNALAVMENDDGMVMTMQRNYQRFLRALHGLPTTNPAGMPLNVNTLDCEGSVIMTVDGAYRPGRKANVTKGRFRITPERIAEAPDILVFERQIYGAFIERMTLLNGELIFKTIFGVELKAPYALRDYKAFIGFRRCSPDGSVEFLMERYQVHNCGISSKRAQQAAGKPKREQANGMKVEE